MHFAYKRSGLKEFLEELPRMFDVWLFTSAKKEYADAILKKIDPDDSIFKKRLYRQNCVEDEHGQLVKYISVLDGASL